MSLQTYTLEEVKLHKKVKGKEKDAWVVLHDKVYDISKFVDEVVRLYFIFAAGSSI